MSGSTRARLAAPVSAKAPVRADIQGLRMVAVLLVVLNHLFGRPAGGFVGVDIFFVISGFLITGMLLRNVERTGRVLVGRFYLARFRRIVPAATFALIVVTVAAWFLFNRVRADAVVTDSVWALLLSVNWHFASVGTDYFAAGGPVSPVQHYWSLSVEQQLYLVWPVLVLLALLLARRSSRYRLVLGVVLALVVAGSLWWALGESASDPTVAYFSTVSRTWELAVGGLIAVGSVSLGRLPAWSRPLLSWLGLGVIGLSVVLIDETSAFPGPWAVLPVVGTALVVAAGTGGRVRFLWPLTNPVAGYLGDLSFSIYLWHFPVIVFVGVVLGTGTGPTLAAAGIFMALAVFSYHLLEDPIRRSSWLVPGRERVGGFYRPGEQWLAGVLVFVVAAVGTVVALSRVSDSPAPVAGPSSRPSSTVAVASDHAEVDALQVEIVLALKATSWPDLSPSLDEVMAGNQAPDDVLRCGTHVVDESRCTWGDPDATHTIVTVGDSVSMTYVEALRQAIGTNSGWNLVSYGMFGCPFRDEVPAEAPDGCAERTGDAVAAINRLKPDVVIYSGIADGEGAGAPLARLTGKPTVVFLPGPPREVDPMTCFTAVSSPGDCVDHLDGDWGRLKVAAKKLGVVYLDSSKWFCVKDNCPIFVGTTPVRMDRFHMTTAYAGLLAPVMREALERTGVL